MLNSLILLKIQKIKGAIDSTRREELKTALNFFFVGGLGFPQTEIKVSLTGVCPSPHFS